MYKNFLKGLFDFFLALIVLAALFPFILILFILLFIANQGSPLFFQDRPGKNNRIFRLVKFKNMNDRRDAAGKLLPDKDRLTGIGRFIRSTSMDELPQLINLHKGKKSLMLPRLALFQSSPDSPNDRVEKRFYQMLVLHADRQYFQKNINLVINYGIETLFLYSIVIGI